MTEYGVSERHACKLLEMDRTSYRYEPQPDRSAELRKKLIELAKQKPRYGYRRLHALLERRGWVVDHKRLERVYREEHLAVRRLKRKRLATCRSIRALTVVDSYSRECLAIDVDSCLSAAG